MGTSYTLTHSYAIHRCITRSRIVLPVKPHELIHALVERDGGALPVAKKMGSAAFQPTLHRFISGETESPTRRTAERIARHYRIPVDTLYSEKLATEAAKRLLTPQSATAAWMPEQHLSEGGGTGELAHDMSQIVPQDEPPKIEWEFILTGAVLPDRFEAAMPDDALAPRTTRGTRFTFSTSVTPNDGDVAIFESRTGRRYMRLFFAVGVNEWEARTRDPAQPALHSDRDGLRVLATATHRAGGQG